MRHPRLILAAHGSADPRFAATVEAIAARVRASRPELDVRIGFLEHGPPHVEDVTGPDDVVVPLLLSSGYHVRVDLPARMNGASVAAAVGPDARLAGALADRLHEAGWDGLAPVTLAAAGSTDERSTSDVRRAAELLAEQVGVAVTAAFVSAGTPRLADAAPTVVASYLLADGAFQDAVTGCGASVVSAPLGDHPAVAAVVLDRYDAAAAPQTPGRTAPA